MPCFYKVMLSSLAVDEKSCGRTFAGFRCSLMLTVSPETVRARNLEGTLQLAACTRWARPVEAYQSESTPASLREGINYSNYNY